MKKIILIISVIICILIIFKPEKQIPDYHKELDSLESEISIIKNKRDSIKERIDTTIIKIKENEKYYKETVNTIISNDVTDDYIFFTNYLKWNRERLDSISNSPTIKGN